MDQANVPTTELNTLTDSLATNTAPSFIGGIVTTNIAGYSYSYGQSVAVQADGKILLGGAGGKTGSSYDFALVRYNADGLLDLSFDGDGIVTTSVGYSSYGSSVAIQADGKILLGGGGNNDFALVRYNSDGSLDTGFDGDGIVTTDIDGDYGSSVTVQADGKILLGGTSSSSGYAFALMRYNSDGSLDSSFGIAGKVTTDMGNKYSDGQSVTVQADGKILLGGYTENNSRGYDFALVRYNTDGSLDLSFDGDGIVTTRGFGYSVTVQVDGKILLGGGNGDFTLARYNTDGSLDLSFDSDGTVSTDVGSSGQSVTLQTDGKILLAGAGGDGVDFALVRYNPNGSLDTGFDGDGIVTTDLGGSDNGSSVTAQADGKILLGGTSNNNFALVRYNPDGSLDLSFNPNSISTLNGNASYTENGAPVVLDSTVQIYDAELAAQDNYNGASITLARHGGANAEDVFSGSGQLSFNGNDGVVSGVTIGTVSNSNGTLSINFNSEASQARVDAVLSSIAYRNATDYPPVPSDTPASVQIDWTFSDGNSGAQGTGEALTTTGSSIINISANLGEIIGTTKNDNLAVLGGDKGYGFTGNDYFYSYSNNKYVNENVYSDTLVGGKGNDTYAISNNDVVIENLNEGTDTIISRYSIYVLPANVENLTLHANGWHSVNGKGNDLANTLIGNGHDNRLSGGAGADTLTGGFGADTFKFNKAAETGITATTRDSIVDFSHDQGDKINLAAIDANTALKGDNAFAAPTVGDAFSGTFANQGELYFDQTAHILYGNNDADSTADFSIKVMGVTSLVAADFVL